MNDVEELFEGPMYIERGTQQLQRFGVSYRPIRIQHSWISL